MAYPKQRDPFVLDRLTQWYVEEKRHREVEHCVENNKPQVPAVCVGFWMGYLVFVFSQRGTHICFKNAIINS